MTYRLKISAVGVTLSAALVLPSMQPAHGRQQETRTSNIQATRPRDIRAWDARVDRMIRDRSLQLRQDREDMVVRGRRHSRYRQVVDGVPVYGGDISRQTDGTGATISIFGTIYEGIAIDTTAQLGPDEVRAIVERHTGVPLGPARQPRLSILPRDGRAPLLVYLVRVATPADLTLYFVDANSGAIVDQQSDAKTQTAAIGVGTGVLGDTKKVSASSQSGGFVEVDRKRPPVIETYDMRGNLNRTLNFLNGFINLSPSDLATDADNNWTDGANVDAHTYAGFVYDYYFKRFNRRGLDNANIKIISLTHPVRRQDVFTQPGNIIGLFYVNAAYFGDGIMMYGEGLPPNVTLGGQRFDFFAGALDIVAHELTHGVTDYSSQLIYRNESGALNEAFSDIMGTAVEFFYQEPGSGPQRAEYLGGEDITPGGFRSLEDPGAFGDPDHYSRRFLGTADNGGVHINSGIANHAYFLAIEGGTNRTSGLSVQGVGRANREQMEQVFYRAFTQLLTASATFSDARAATIQAARDLFGANSAAERAVTQAWTAVGVE